MHAFAGLVACSPHFTLSLPVWCFRRNTQAPVLVHNLLCVKQGKTPNAKYDGYTSCPLVTGYSSLLLCEFKYGGELAETFGAVLDQAEPRWAFMQLKKYVFPAAYWELFLRGRWFGPKGPIPPTFDWEGAWWVDLAWWGNDEMMAVDPPASMRGSRSMM